MAVSIHERFENHIDTASPETSGDAKRETDTEEDPYDKGFEEKLTLARIKGAEQQDSGIEKNEEDDSPQKRRISTFSRETKNYTMNSDISPSSRDSMRMPREHRNNMDMKTSAVITARMVIGSTILTDQVEMTSLGICLEICFTGEQKAGISTAKDFITAAVSISSSIREKMMGSMVTMDFTKLIPEKGRIWKRKIHDGSCDLRAVKA